MIHVVKQTQFIFIKLDEWRGMMNRAVDIAYREVHGRDEQQLSINQVSGALSIPYLHSLSTTLPPPQVADALASV